MTRLILALLAALLLAAGCAAPPVAIPPATPTPQPRLFWEAATVASSELNSASLVVLPGGDGLVAIGYDGRFGSILWTSTDGRAWRDVTPPAFASAGLAGAVRFDGGLLAVGRGDTFDVDTETGAAWLSPDGTTWRRAAGGPDLVGQMIDVLTTDAGFFAIGGVPGDDAAGIWRSSDGETWERTGGDFGGAFMWSIAEGGPGLVVTGWRRNPEPDLAVWTSPDGVEWTLAPDPEGFDGFEGLDVLSYNGTLVMVGGSISETRSRIWTSDDGVVWQPSDVPDSLAKGTSRKLVATPAGLLALGSSGRDGAAWISRDGRSWEAFGDPVPNAFFTSAFVSGDSIVVTGATQEGTTETGIDVHAQIWMAAPATD